MSRVAATLLVLAFVGSAAASPPEAPSNFVVGQNLIVRGSGCIGSDCQDDESLAGASLRLKQDFLFLLMDDLSTEPGLPNNDWGLRANAALLERFSILDWSGVTAEPFGVAGGAPNHSLYVDDQGRVGLGTSAPPEALSLAAPPGVALSFEATSSSQTWQIGAVPSIGLGFLHTAASVGSLPLRIAPPAVGGGMVLSLPEGGPLVPGAPLHVLRSDGSARVMVQETSAPTIGRNLLRLVNNGPSTFRFDNTATGGSWGFGALNTGDFFIGSSGAPALAAALTPAGVLTVAQVQQTSDRDAKQDIEPADGEAMLASLRALPVRSWRLRHGLGDGATHIGPLAQDFAQAFGLGEDDRHISALDMAGVALAALRALDSRLDEREAELGALRRQQHELRARVARAEQDVRGGTR